jgi:formylglycine-generating enzyme required for sulfatase activity
VYDDLDATDAAVTREFWIMETEVTQEQFESEMGYHPSQFTACGATCPVENLLWDELAAYANALSILDGLENCYECSGSGTDVAKTPQFLST